MLNKFVDRLSTLEVLLIKPKVKNRSGEELGEIEELILDPEDGSVSGAILNAHTSEEPEKRVYVPGKMLSCGWSPAIIVDVEKEFLEKIPDEGITLVENHTEKVS
jgi:sporulation protein YlmC with PRC-barrel domain